MNRTLLRLSLVASLAAACGVGSTDAALDLLPINPPVTNPGELPQSPGGSGSTQEPPVMGQGGGTGQQEPDPPTMPGACEPSRTYVGLGGLTLKIGKSPGSTPNRRQLKPYSALGEEYQRVLGAIPAGFDAAASTFGQPPSRWFAPASASAFTVTTAYDLALTGCRTLTAGASRYATAPAAATAATECRDLAIKFWSRAPTDAEVDGCVKVAMQNTSTLNDPRLRWAHVCATVLTSAGFLTY